MIVSVTVSDGMVAETASINIDELLFKEAAYPLDFPKVGADAIQTMFCTSRLTIQAVMTDRQKLSDIISKTTTKLLIDMLSARDTVMGYRSK
jgi:hypothetical protein